MEGGSLGGGGGARKDKNVKIAFVTSCVACSSGSLMQF